MARKAKDALTPRQMDLLKLIAQGLRNRDIAKRLGISVQTVEVHRQMLYAVMDVGNTAQLIARALQRKLITVADMEPAA